MPETIPLDPARNTTLSARGFVSVAFMATLMATSTIYTICRTNTIYVSADCGYKYMYYKCPAHVAVEMSTPLFKKESPEHQRQLLSLYGQLRILPPLIQIPRSLNLRYRVDARLGSPLNVPRAVLVFDVDDFWQIMQNPYTVFPNAGLRCG